MNNILAAGWVMCAPQFFGVEYVINPWMEGHIGCVKQQKAHQQWEALYNILIQRTNIHLIPPISDLPDMPFTANAGLALGKVFVPAVFRFPQRRGEERYFRKWFQECGYQIEELNVAATFEGEGDALFQPEEALLWAGYGVRSSLAVHLRLSEIFDVEVVSLRLVDSKFYHLDTCFVALPGGRIIYYPPAFDAISLELLHQRVPPQKRFAVSEEDAINFACNAIICSGAYICNYASPSLQAQLHAWDLEVITTSLTEFMLAGGAAKCLSLCLAHEVPPSHVIPKSEICIRTIELQGHVLDKGLLTDVIDIITSLGGDFEILQFQAGLRHDQESTVRIQISMRTVAQMEKVLPSLFALNARSTCPPLPLSKKKINPITNNTIKIKKIIFAIPTAAPAIPVKPKAAAMMAMTKNITIHDNMINSL